MLTEILGLLAPVLATRPRGARAARSGGLHARPRRPCHALLRGVPAGPADRARPRPRGSRPGRRAAGAARRSRHPGPGRLRPAARGPRRSRPVPRPGRAARPGTVVAADRRPRAWFRLRRRRPARHADEPRRPLSAADVLNTYSARELATILRRYGEERFADRIAASDRRRARARAVHHLGPAGRAALRAPSRRQPARPAVIRRSAPSRHCGSRSTPSSPRWSRCCPAPSRRWRSAAGSRCWPTTRSRTGWSSSCSRWVPPTRRRATCRSSRTSTHQSCAC